MLRTTLTGLVLAAVALGSIDGTASAASGRQAPKPLIRAEVPFGVADGMSSPSMLDLTTGGRRAAATAKLSQQACSGKHY